MDRRLKSLSLHITLGYVWMLLSMTARAEGTAGKAGAFLRTGVGARALAIGAFTAIADDASATYWNPAGLSGLSDARVYGTYARYSLDRRQNFMSLVLPTRRGAFGISWLGFGVAGIEARSSNTLQPDYIFSDSENALLISYAQNLGSIFSFGTNLKLLHHKLERQQAFGSGADFALRMNFFNRLHLGVMLQDFGGSLKWPSGYTDQIPLCLRVGCALRLSRRLTLAFESASEGINEVDLRVGTEIKAINEFPLRFGVDHRGAVSMGSGFSAPLDIGKIELDYCYSKDAFTNENVHKVSAAFAFRRNGNHEEQQESEILVEVTVPALNVRSGPGIHFKRIGIAKQGKKFRLIERKSDWLKIRYSKDRIGWVSAKYMRMI
ncbi:PorV/PorQ family protein [candidate division KSB1 bacterium]|nr:PorV/PorQ family protein [candidate division KSB1 bacterium]